MIKGKWIISQKYIKKTFDSLIIHKKIILVNDGKSSIVKLELNDVYMNYSGTHYQKEQDESDTLFGYGDIYYENNPNELFYTGEIMTLNNDLFLHGYGKVYYGNNNYEGYFDKCTITTKPEILIP
jgi:hypothetical protein